MPLLHVCSEPSCLFCCWQVTPVIYNERVLDDSLLARAIHVHLAGSTCSLKRSSGENTMFSYLSWVPAPATISNIRSQNDSCTTCNFWYSRWVHMLVISEAARQAQATEHPDGPTLSYRHHN